jgi:prepilin peptidase CpaA
LLAIGWDVKTHRIPNVLVLVGLSLGLLISTWPGGIGLGHALYGGLTGLAVYLPLYLLRILGAGDVKLMAAVGAFVGFPDVMTVALITALAGLILSVLIAIRHRQLHQMTQHVYQGLIGFMWQIASGGRPQQWVMVIGPHRLPYAMAIGLGTLTHLYIQT